MSEWQPIETAPRETRVLVWDGEPRALTLTDCYGPTIQHPNNPSGDLQRRERGIEHCYEWRDDSGDGDQDYRPTHWQPIVTP